MERSLKYMTTGLAIRDNPRNPRNPHNNPRPIVLERPQRQGPLKPQLQIRFSIRNPELP